MTAASSVRQRRLALIAWIAVCLIWGTTYLGIRITLESMPPWLMGGLRWTVAGGLLALYMLAVALGDVSGKGVPAALYSVFAAELIRGRTFRRRYLPDRSGPASVLSSVNTILYQRQLEEYYCTLCYAIFDLKRRIVTLANSGLPYPIRASAEGVMQIELPGVPLGSFQGSTYDELTYALHTGDTFVFCSDGVFEAMNVNGEEFGAARLMKRPAIAMMSR